MPNNPELERILEKLVKIKELADRSTNEGEIQAAIAAMNRIMQEYNITLAEIEGANPNNPVNPLIQSDFIRVGNKNLEQWINYLFSYLCKYNFCKWSWHSRPNGLFVSVWGRKANVDVVVWLANNLMSRLQKIADKKFAEYKANYHPAKDGRYIHGKTWKVSFLIGAVVGIATKLDEQFREFSDNHNTLIVIRENEIIEAQKEKYPNMRGSTRGQHKNSLYSHIYEQGVETGKNMDLQKAIQ